MDKRAIWAVLVIIGAFFGLRAIFFEKVEVPDVNWGSRYNYDGKDVMDLWLFKSLLKERYQGVEHRIVSDLDMDEDSLLIVMVGNRMKPTNSEMTKLIQMVRAGNYVLFSGQKFVLKNYLFTVEDHENLMADTISFRANGTDFTASLNWRALDRSSVQFFQPLTSIVSTIGTSPENGMDATFKGWWRITLFDLETPHHPKAAIESKIMLCFPVGEGQICFHNAPYLFTNIASKQDFYLPHFNKVFGTLPAKKVILTKPQRTVNSKKGLFQYFLAYRSFRWAYYLLLAAILLYIFFRGKRIQRTIPLLPKKENTSLEFIGTVSRLYRAHQSTAPLAQKMKSNFIFFVEEQYRIYPSDERYWEKLQKKSKMDEKLLEALKMDIGDVRLPRARVNADIQKMHHTLSKFYKLKL